MNNEKPGEKKPNPLSGLFANIRTFQKKYLPESKKTNAEVNADLPAENPPPSRPARD
jgi:hypothetical protein